jgi:DNA-directed RNA polymerase subunit M/transcription elongation factor TFIIS
MKHAQHNHEREQSLQSQEDEVIICPECGSDDVSPLHHEGNFAIPETYYKHCNECGHSWGFE